MTNESGITPLDVRVLVLPDPVEEKTKGGIFLPEAHQEREHAKLRAIGFDVLVLDTIEKVDAFVERMT